VSAVPTARAQRHAVEEAVHPVAEGLLAEARRRAQDIEVAAQEDARRQVDAATSEAARSLDEARRQGEDAARRSCAHLLVEARQQARWLVLDVRRQAYESLRREALTQLARRRETPEGVALRERLAAGAQRLLGPDAVVADQDDGGVVAVLGARRVDLRAAVLVDGAMGALGSRLSEMWA